MKTNQLIIMLALMTGSIAFSAENDHLDKMICESLYTTVNLSDCLAEQTSPTFISVDDNLEMALRMVNEKNVDLAEQFILKAKKQLGVRK